MSEIEVFTLITCPNCKKLEMMLDRAGIPYTEYNIEKSTEALAEAAYRGIVQEQYPVVYIDGKRLPADTPIRYFEQIKEAME